ncbi:hypothetical protein B0H10DRAFT_2246920 [Mycena sp. CBHHK59/15]|nr:hypothetical protein B0H10DRAFT_2246920 [Mycena sp. CBHHK59/15]
MDPPFYILCARTSLAAPTPAPALVHPAIQYHYADDPPLALLPIPQSTFSPAVAVTALRIEEAPGAAADAVPRRNDRMYIVETTAAADRPLDASLTERRPAHAVLAQFKQRNTIMRRALLYPNISAVPGASFTSNPRAMLSIRATLARTTLHPSPMNTRTRPPFSRTGAGATDSEPQKPADSRSENSSMGNVPGEDSKEDNTARRRDSPLHSHAGRRSRRRMRCQSDDDLDYGIDKRYLDPTW